MHRSKRIFGTGVAVLVSLAFAGTNSRSSLAAADTWTPIVSKVRETVTEIPASGPEVVTEAWEGTYLRDIDGSVLRKLQKAVPSEPQPAKKGVFIDRSSQGAYDLVFSTRTAVLIQNKLPERDDASAVRKKAISLGRKEEAFQGISCFAMPVETTEFGGVPFSGKGCYSPEYDLHLYQILERAVAESGLTIRTVTELYDLEVGRSPEANAVRLPAGFVVQEGACSTCETEP